MTLQKSLVQKKSSYSVWDKTLPQTQTFTLSTNQRVSTRSARASEDEKEFLPVFMHLIGFNKLVLDLVYKPEE
jgi:hypothetical protein